MVSRNLTHGGSPIINDNELENDNESLNSSSTTNLISNPFNNNDDDNYKIDEFEYSTDSSTPNRKFDAENDKSYYDRYSSNSRIVSQDGSHLSLLSGATSGNPFIMDSDFSPFGGYPLTSFPLHIEEEEPDDYLHNPDPILDLEYDKNRFLSDLKNMDWRSAGGLAGLLLVVCGIIAVFVILPVLTYTGVTHHHHPVNHKSHNSHHTTYKYQTTTLLTDYIYPVLSAIRRDLIDPDTPEDAMTRTARDGSEWQLVFSDEFNVEGRTFYDGDDQFWYGADFNYASTQDLEWYDPDLITTSNGSLQLRLDAIKQHNLYYRSGMIHSWNRLCFTQGIMEVSVRLPHLGNVTGLWPGLWSLGNLGRSGYRATTDGVWPYSYELCDAGITANQSSPDGISYLPGQRLNSCTCEGEEHPNRGVGRGAPEIDILEGEVDTKLGVGVLSQSLQVLPMDIWYFPDANFIELHNKSVSSMNTYTGGPFQQAVSLTTTLNTKWYQKGDFLEGEGEFQKYSFEYLNDNDDGYIRWFVGDEPTMTLHAYALAPNGNIDWRRISKEPMSMVLNLGISTSWAYIDWPGLSFPSIMEIDHVRIYQPEDQISVTCDPEDYPTYDYIQDHLVLYEDYNVTSWEGAGYSYPRNNLTGC